MSIQVTCDKCCARFKAPDAAAGKKGKCSKCGATLVVPALAAPAPVPAAEPDDMYDIASEPPPPLPTSRPPPAPPYNAPPQSQAAPMSSAAMSRGVVPKSPNAGAWKESGNPPAIMKILGTVVGVVLILLGLLIVAGPILMMMSDKSGKTVRFKGVFIGVGLIVTGVTAIAKSFGKAGG
jgi:hypothetical protein